MKKQLIIGLGTGRCGTVSLSRLLNSQKNSNVSHESKPILTWKFDKEKIESKLNAISDKKGRYIGDVAFYYLPYVRYILKKFPNTKFVCLKRLKNEVIKSYLFKTKGRNHLIDHFGNKWKKDNKWDYAFPKYDLNSKEEAIGVYWEDYYKEVRGLIKKYPKNIEIFDIDELNSNEGVKRILNFCGVDKNDQKVIANLKENSTKDKLSFIKYWLWRTDKIR